jgi:hypothetical protein
MNHLSWIGQKEIYVFDHNLILLSMLTTKSRTFRPKLVLLIQITLKLEFPVSETKHGGVCVWRGGLLDSTQLGSHEKNMPQVVAVMLLDHQLNQSMDALERYAPSPAH